MPNSHEEGVTRKDALMTQAIFAFAQGCGGSEISEEACAAFHRRYYPWIDKKKENEKAKGRSPQDVWETQGKDFLGHFYNIGQRVARDSGGEPIQAAILETSAISVETENDCPWCPLRP